MNEPQHEEILGRCLTAAVDGSYFPEWEFHVLMGLARDEMRAIAETWPDPTADTPHGYDSAAHAQRVAVNNAANNLIGGYPHGVQAAVLEQELGCTVGDVARALAAWRGEGSYDASAKGYFDRLM